MRLNDNSKRMKSVATPRRVGIALLFFVAHAFFVSATHFHRLDPATQAHAQVNQSVGCPAAKDDGADTNNHAQCLLCRLQRNLIADLDAPVAPVVAPLPEFIGDTAQPPATHPDRAFLSPGGRAPPQV